MTTSWPSPERWQDARLAAEQTTWPGPRPLSERDGRRALVGRDEDEQDLIDAVRGRQLIHLQGESGVGKSSFLMAGAIPAIRRAGRSVMLCRSWAIPDDLRFDVFLAQRLRESLPPGQRELYPTMSRDMFSTMSERGDVIVLDQFEELIRRDRKQRRQIFGFLKNVVERTNIRIILSYRADSLALFKDLDRMVDRNLVKTLVLEPVAPSSGLELIHSPRLPEGVDSWQGVIGEKVAHDIFDMWVRAQETEPQIGLLHLQALLFDLMTSAQDRKRSAISAEDLAGFKARAETALARRGRTTVSDAEYATYALEEAATTRLRVASDVAKELGWNTYLIESVNRMASEILPELSSGGFKIELEMGHLAEKVLEDELEHAYNDVPPDRRATTSAHELIDAVVRALSPDLDASSAEDEDATRSNLAQRRTVLVAAVGSHLGWPDEVTHELFGARANAQMASGPTLGLSDAEVLLEQVRAFWWAALWLHELNLARISSAEHGSSMTLIHDGFGAPLKRWSAGWVAENPAWVFRSIAAAPGSSHDLDQEQRPGASRSVSGTPAGPRLHVNLTLKGNSVLFAEFSRAVFVNCDFRGALFLRCSFDGVTFVNCRLDGALFSDCTIRGSQALDLPASTEDPERLRSVEHYLLSDGVDEAVSAIAQYAETTELGPLLAAPPGTPARVASGTDLTSGRWPEPLLAPSGLVVQGGRMSALTLRGTTFEDGAALVLIRTRGSGVDVAEVPSITPSTSPTRIVVRESLVRHLSVTTSAQKPEEGWSQDSEASQPPVIEIKVDNSGVAQWWIGAGLTGTVRIVNSQCAQLWVDDPTEDATNGVAAGATDSWVKDLVGVTSTGGGVLGDPVGDPDGARLDFFRDGARSTDYQR